MGAGGRQYTAEVLHWVEWELARNRKENTRTQYESVFTAMEENKPNGGKFWNLVIKEFV